MNKELAGCSENKIRLFIRAQKEKIRKETNQKFQMGSKPDNLEKHLQVLREQKGQPKNFTSKLSFMYKYNIQEIKNIFP